MDLQKVTVDRFVKTDKINEPEKSMSSDNLQKSIENVKCLI